MLARCNKANLFVQCQDFHQLQLPNRMEMRLHFGRSKVLTEPLPFQDEMRNSLGKHQRRDHPTGKFERADDGLLHLVGASLRAFFGIHPDDIPKEVPQAINFVYEVRQDLTSESISCQSPELSWKPYRTARPYLSTPWYLEIAEWLEY